MDNRWRPSVTVAAIIEQDGRFLLVEEETSHGLKLNNPAGHLEVGESPVEGCAREALEEAAWHFHPTHMVGVYMSRFRKKATGEDITDKINAERAERGEPPLSEDTGGRPKREGGDRGGRRPRRD